MNMHVNRPETGSETIPPALQTALRTLAKLRLEARDEIERLLTFLDESDPYVMTECEPDLTGYSTGMDGREGDSADDEPSLGWTVLGTIGSDADLELEEVSV
jgi:hypothetical protein